MEFLLKIRRATRYDRARLEFSVVPLCEPAATGETVPYKGEGALRRHPCVEEFFSWENFSNFFFIERTFSTKNLVLMYTVQRLEAEYSGNMMWNDLRTKFQFIFLSTPSRVGMS